MKTIPINNIKTIQNKIPLLGVPDKPIISITQKLVPIADITEDIVLTKDGGAAIVLESTSLNFSLLSEKEQQAVISSYAALINSLNFSIQIVVRSQVKDIKKYFEFLSEKRQKITNPKLAELMDDYKKFVSETIKKKNVLGKSFYLVIPFSPLEMGVAKTAQSLVKKREGPLPFSKTNVIKKAKIALYPKRDHLIRQARRLGLKLRQLNTTQLINLYFLYYNPGSKLYEEEQTVTKPGLN